LTLGDGGTLSAWRPIVFNTKLGSFGENYFFEKLKWLEGKALGTGWRFGGGFANRTGGGSSGCIMRPALGVSGFVRRHGVLF
jgi:hypothetical protein